jgi:WXG100 family type VII secretion target
VSGKESTAEEIIELGIEVIKPGGRPEELEQAAKEWRSLKTEVEGILRDLNKEVEGAVGDTWRGPAAEAFEEHWKNFKSTVDKSTEQFDEAAEGLDKAAKGIREVNEKVEKIYTEIGISVAVSVGMSFLTVGVSAAVGTARVTMLVNRALDLCRGLGSLLRAVGTAFRTLYNSGRAGKLAAEGLANWASGTAGGMATSLASGKGFEVTSNLAGGLGGATAGAAAGKAASALGKGDFTSGVATGAVGGVAGDALNSTPVFSDKEFDAKQSAVTAITGGAAGGLSGTARGFDRGMKDIADDMSSDFNYRGERAEHDRIAGDLAFGSSAEVSGGISANTGKDAAEEIDQIAGDASSGASEGVAGDSASPLDKIREDFG